MESCPVLKQQVATLTIFIYILFGITIGKWNARKWNLLKAYVIQVCGISIYKYTYVCVCVYKYPSMKVKKKKKKKHRRWGGENFHQAIDLFGMP